VAVELSEVSRKVRLTFDLRRIISQTRTAGRVIGWVVENASGIKAISIYRGGDADLHIDT
jgi:hypothetical protein